MRPEYAAVVATTPRTGYAWVVHEGAGEEVHFKQADSAGALLVGTFGPFHSPQASGRMDLPSKYSSLKRTHWGDREQLGRPYER